MNQYTRKHLTKTKKAPLLKGDLFNFIDYRPNQLLIATDTCEIVTNTKVNKIDLIQRMKKGRHGSTSNWSGYRLKFIENVLLPSWVDK